MKALITLAALVVSCSLALHDVADAHGGTYRGPGGTTPAGDTVAPGSSGGSSGSSSGGSTSGGTSQGGSSGGAGSGGGGSSQRSSPTPSGPSMPSGGTGATWEPWWAFNRDPFLNLKSVISKADPLLGSDSYFLGHVPLDLVRDQMNPTQETIRQEIVPGLKRALEEETDNDLVTGVLVALAKIGDDPAAGPDDPRMAELIQTYLSSANQEIAETAAISLGILANESSTDLLVALLEDTKVGRGLVGNKEVAWRTRAFAAYGLGLIGYYSSDVSMRRRILDELRETLDGAAMQMPTPDVGVACITAMGLVHLEADPNCLLIAGNCPNASHCRRGQIEWLHDYAQKSGLNYVLRSHIPTTMARLARDSHKDPQLVPLVANDLLQWAQSSSKIQRHLRASSIMALGAIGTAGTQKVDRQIFDALKGSAKNSRLLEVRTLALVALGQAGGRRGAGGAFDPETVDEVRAFLLDQFKNGRSTDRGWAAIALSMLDRFERQPGQLASSEASSEIRKALASATSPSQVGAYAVALGVMQDGDSASVILEKLEKLSDDRSRGYLCVSLGLMNARETVDDLRKILKESRYRPLLMREAAISLGLLGDKNVVEDLIQEMQDSTSLTAQSSIASALGSIGDARSVEPLLKMLGDSEVNVRARAFAAVALGIVGDKEPLPWNSKIAVGANYMAGTPTLTDGQGAGVLDIL